MISLKWAFEKFITEINGQYLEIELNVKKLAEHYPKTAFLMTYSFNGKEINYVAAHHGRDETTHALIEQIFETNPPSAVVIEGKPEYTSAEDWIEICLSNEVPQSESSTATVLADAHKAKIFGGEPPLKDIYQAIINAGYSRQDFIGWQISEMLNAVKINNGEYDDAIKNRSKTLMALIGEEDTQDYNFSFYQNWFKKNFGKKFNMKELSEIDFYPSTLKGSNIIQNLALLADSVREPHIITTILKALSENNKVLVVYGASHAMKHHQSLEKLTSSAGLITQDLNLLSEPLKKQDPYPK